MKIQMLRVAGWVVCCTLGGRVAAQTLIPASAAVSPTVPFVSGEGVRVEVFANVGGDRAPTPADLDGLTPAGETLMPKVYWRRRKDVTGPGSLEDFFAECRAMPPATLRELDVTNFTLRVTGLLKVTRDWDRDATTEAIEAKLGLSYQGGWWLAIGDAFQTNGLQRVTSSVTKSATFPLTFTTEGLYPVTLLFTGEAGYSAYLTFWRGYGTGRPTIPVSRWYQQPTPALQEATFEEWSAGKRLTDELLARGVRFRTVSGDLRITDNQPEEFAPVTPPRVYGDPSTPAAPGELELQFVEPGTTNRSTTAFAQFYLVNAGVEGATTVTAYAPDDTVLFQRAYHGGVGTRERVAIEQPNLARVRITLGEGAHPAALDSLSFQTPADAPDLVVRDLVVPETVAVHEPFVVRWTVENAGTRPTRAEWTDVIEHGAHPWMRSVRHEKSVRFRGTLAPGESVTREAEISVGTDYVGERYFRVRLDHYDDVAEASEANNQIVTGTAVRVQAPDIALEEITAPDTADQGATITVSALIRNVGDAPVTAGSQWRDILYLARTETGGSRQLLLRPLVTVTNPIPVNGTRRFTFEVTLPLRSDTPPGDYFLRWQAAGKWANDPDKSNNTLARALTLTQPPLPDLAVTALTAPGEVTATKLITVRWTVTNHTDYAAPGPWHETVAFSANAQAGDDDDVVLKVLKFRDGLPPHGSDERVTQLSVPPIPGGGGWFVVTTDSRNELPEAGPPENNVRVAAARTTLRAMDLVVEDVVAPTSAFYGDSIPVAWTVRNVGDAPAEAAWRDTVYLSSDGQPDAPFAYWRLGTFGRPRPLAPGEGYRRTNTVTLPLRPDYPDTDWVIEIRADSSRQQPEADEENNVATRGPLALRVPKLPNLVITNLVAPASADPGQTIPLVWTVLNTGPGEAVAPWRERVFVSDDPELGDDLSLATFQIETPLPAGASLTRTQQVMVPVNGFWGDQWFVVQADSAGEVVEEDETDNAALSVRPTTVAAALSLRLNSVAVRETAGTNTVKALLKRNTDPSTNLVVTLTSSDPTEAAVPATVVIPAHRSSVRVPVTVVADHYVDGDQNVRITAEAPEFVSGSDWLTVQDVDTPALTLVTEEGIAEGAVAQGWVRRNCATNETLEVDLWTDNLWRLRASASVVLAPGETEAPFEYRALENDTFEGLSKARLLATATNYPNASRTIQILDNDTTTIELTVADTTLTESGPSSRTEATVTRSPVTDRGLRISFSTEAGGPLAHPRRWIIPPNQASVTFPVAAEDDSLVNGDRTARLTAYAVNELGAPMPDISSSVEIKVRDDDGPTLTLRARPGFLAETGVGEGTVTRNTEAVGDVTVTLASSDPSEATVPATVVIPDGRRRATFPIHGVTDGVTDGAREITLTASAAGWSGGLAHLTVSDIDLPDLEVLDVNGPTNLLTDASATVRFSVANHGLAAAEGPWSDYVYVSPTRHPGARSAVAISRFNGALAVGGSYERTARVSMPTRPGHYWICVRTDAERDLTEGTRRNNVGCALLPVDVLPAYQAVAWTEAEVEPNGTPIPIEGRAWMTQNTNAPAALEEIEITVRVRRMRRTLTVWTDTEGRFSTVFQPLPTEAGVYTLSAQYPGDAESDQDQFILLGMKTDVPELNLRLVPGEPLSGTFKLRNLGDLPLSGLTGAVLRSPSGLEAQFELADELPGDGEIPVRYTLTSTSADAWKAEVTFHLESAEGVFADLPVRLTVLPLRAELAARPAYLERGMVRGEQAVTSFEVVNLGGAPSGPLTVLLPPLPWLSLASGETLPPLAPGEKATVTLRLHPPADLPLARYDGKLALVGAAAGVSVPFHFRAISTAVGDLHVAVEDQYTYYVAGTPLVTNALVTLRDPFTGETVAEENTGETGEVRFTGLPEGSYRVEVFAPRHSGYHGVAAIEAGVTTELRPFLSRETVTYRWRVVPTEIEDHYRIVLESVFEAEVPVPNLVVETPFIMPLVTPGYETQTEIILRNEGLIALQDVHFGIPQDPDYEITPLVKEIGTMPAKSRYVIPVTIRHRNIPLVSERVGLAGESRGLAGGKDCEIGVNECLPKIPMPVFSYYVCGPDNKLQKVTVDFRPLCTDYNAYKCLKGLKDAYKKAAQDIMSGHGLGGALCDAVAAVADCLNPNIPPCIKGPLKAACKVAAGDPGGGIGDLLECLCSKLSFDFSDLDVSLDGSTFPGIPAAGGIVSSTAWYPVGPPEKDCGDEGGPGAFRRTSAVALAGEGDGGHGRGVCAQVRMRIEQEAVMTRAAFIGTLEINNTGADALTGLRVDLEITDARDQPANDRFVLRSAQFSGVEDMTGQGELGPGRAATARYTFIPTLDAAPDAPAIYSIGGTLRYFEAGEEIVVPLSAPPIVVLPEARLALDYFQQRDVYADDPFTDEVEPSEPFALGLIAKNIGAGWARNFRITSAQPKLVENEKGLLIDFKIIGAQVGDAEVRPSLTVDLGNIGPGTTQVAAWWLTSTLQGKFLDYHATFEHVDSLGCTNLSLIDRVAIHELIHVVRADRPDDDALPDFLVNDDEDPQNTPDMLYLSDGSTAVVNAVHDATTDHRGRAGRFEVALTANLPDGWSYLRLPDPGAHFHLTRVVRSDGKELRVGDNVWQTDRTFPSALHGAVREWTLHLLDYDSSGRYTLTYEVQDTVPPAFSAVVPPEPLLQPGPVHEVDVIFSEPIDLAAFNGDDLILTLNGGPNLIDAGVGVIEVGRNIYRITGLAALTGADGNYELTLVGDGITDYGGNPVGGTARVTWAKGENAPVAFRLGPVTPDPRAEPVADVEVEFSRALDPATLDRNDFVLTRDGGPNLLTDAATVTRVSDTVFRLDGLASLTQADGHYALTLASDGVTDTAGQAGVGVLTTRWTLDSTGPTIVSLEEIPTDPRNIVVAKLDVTFSEPIAPESFDWQDLELRRDGGPNLITEEVTVTPLGPDTFRLANFNWVVGREGRYVLTVHGEGVTDRAGNAGEESASRAWTMDLTPPAAPFDLSLTPDTGVSDTDGRVNTNRLVVAGRVADADVTVRVKDRASRRDLGAARPEGGRFTLPIELNSDGAHPLAVRAVDPAGNVSEKACLDLFVDTTGPRVTVEPVVPNRRLTGVAIVEVHFSEPVDPATLGLDDFTLTRNGAPVAWPAGAVRLEAHNGRDYALTGLEALTEPVGEYVLTANSAGTLDQAGNAGRNQARVTWERVSANTAPRLLAVADQVLPEEETFTLTFTAQDDDIPADTLTFTLDGDVPPGAQLMPASGRFTWRPTESQGPGEYDLRVTVTDNGVPPLSDTRTLHLTVREVNRPPVVTPLPRQRLIEDQPLDVVVSATDPDTPANLLSWRLLPPVPAGLTLDAASGRLQWAPAPEQWGFTNRLTVVVSDDGQPALSTTNQVEVVTVALKPGLNRPRRLAEGGWEFTFKGKPGVQYRLETSDDLKTWRELFDFTVPTRLAPVRDPDPEPHPLHFYRALER